MKSSAAPSFFGFLDHSTWKGLVRRASLVVIGVLGVFLEMVVAQGIVWPLGGRGFSLYDDQVVARFEALLPPDSLARMLNNPNEGLDRFIQTVTDVRLHFVTYSYSGN